MHVFIPNWVVWVFSALFGVWCVAKAGHLYLRWRIRKLERLIKGGA